MAERVLPLRGIAVFEAAARSCSFQAAAAELNLTPSAVSHQIRSLEDVLDVRLFNRLGRGVTLTTDGVEYARAVRQGILRLRTATNDIKSRNKAHSTLDVVRINAPSSFAHCWLLPRLPDLVTRLPDVDFRIVAQASTFRFDRTPVGQPPDSPIDVQIVYGDKDAWGNLASLLTEEVFQPYCSPTFAMEHSIGHLDDLPLGKLISTPSNAISWEEWLTFQGVAADQSRVSTIHVDPAHLAVRAAKNGLGIILESNVLVAQEVANGTLSPLFTELCRPGEGYWLYRPPGRNSRPNVEAVEGWLREYCDPDNSAHPLSLALSLSAAA